MNQIPIVIKGGGIIQRGGDIYESTSDIVVKISDETEDKSLITRGAIGKKFLSRKVEITFTPTKWTKYQDLFQMLFLPRNAAIFGSENKSTFVWGADGQKFVFPRSAITGVPAIGCGIKKELLQEFTITAVQDPRKPYSDLTGLYSRTEVAMPALPTLASTDFATSAFVATLKDNSGGNAEDFSFDLEEGCEISFDIKTSEETNDRLGLYDMTIDDFTPKAKFKPSGISYADYEKMVGLLTAPRRGGLLQSSFDLEVRGVYKDDPLFTLKSVVCSERSFKFSQTEKRFDEIELSAMGTMGLDKFDVGTADADFVIAGE